MHKLDRIDIGSFGCIIAGAMKQYDDPTHRAGETLPEKQRVYRVRVINAFLRVEVPLAIFQRVPEEGAYRLTDTQHICWIWCHSF